MPAYTRIAAQLAAEIEDGTWEPGSALPTIPELIDRFDVSRITVRGAIDALAKQGLVYTGWAGGRRGTLVRSTGRTDHFVTDGMKETRERSDYDAFSENAQRAGRDPSKRFEMRIESPPSDVAERLGSGEDELVVVRTTHELLDGEPWALATSYYPRDLAEEVGLDTPRDIPQGTIRALSDAGHREVACVDEVTDETATTALAQELAVPAGFPLLVQTRTAATTERVTGVHKYYRLGKRNRLIWEIGDAAGIEAIRRTRRIHEETK